MSTSPVRPLILSLLLVGAGCGDEDRTCEEGETEKHGPRCCAGGCGTSTANWLPRICENDRWVCEKGVLEDACASPTNACNPMVACQVVGIDSEEPDPAPELCCEGGCKGTRAVHRVCKLGTLWECPSGSVTVSTCKDYKTACNAILGRYRASGYRLP